MKTFNQLFAALTAGLIASLLALSAADFVGLDLDRAAAAPAETAAAVTRSPVPAGMVRAG